MNRPQATTSRAARAAFFLFAAALVLGLAFDATRADASLPRSADAAALDAAATHPPTSRAVTRELLIDDALERAPDHAPRLGFAEDLCLLELDHARAGFAIFGRETRRCERTYARNNPLKYVDPDGREIRIAGTTDVMVISSIETALDTLAASSPRHRTMVTSLRQSKRTHTIYPTAKLNAVTDALDWPAAKDGRGSGSNVFLNPDNDFVIDLAHELSHAEDMDTGTLNQNPECDGCADVTESKAVRMENLLPQFKRKPIRSYRGERVKNPTAVPPVPPPPAEPTKPAPMSNVWNPLNPFGGTGWCSADNACH